MDVNRILLDILDRAARGQGRGRARRPREHPGGRRRDRRRRHHRAVGARLGAQQRGAADARAARRDPVAARGRARDGPRRARQRRQGRDPRRVRRASSCRWSPASGAGLALGMSGKEALFVGAALTATSVGITARVFGDLRALATVEAKTVLGAAVADDILGLVILTVVTRIVTQGSVSMLGIAVGRRGRGRVRRADDARSACASSRRRSRWVRALQPLARHARRDRARVHARGLRARARGPARADRRRVRRRDRAGPQPGRRPRPLASSRR